MKPKYHGLLSRIFLKGGEVHIGNLYKEDQILLKNLIAWGEVLPVDNGGWGGLYILNNHWINKLEKWYGKRMYNERLERYKRG